MGGKIMIGERKQSVDEIYEQVQRDEERLVKMSKECVKAVYKKGVKA
jgi:hypothetical protein